MTKLQHNKLLTVKKTNNPLMIEIVGPDKEIKRLKDILTIEDKSVAHQIKKLTQKLKFNNYYSDPIEINAQIAELAEDRYEQLYYEDGGKTFIPSGFYYIGNNPDGLGKNTTIKPFLIEGMRPYQIEAVNELLKYNRAQGQLATGLGKSIIISSLALSAVKSGKRVCVVVPSEYLVGQLADTLKEYHDSVDSASGKRHPKLGADIMVVTAQSAKKYIESYQVVIVDESHRLAADTWRDLITVAAEADAVYNLTATAFRADGKDLLLHALGGPIVYRMSAKDGILQDWLCRPEFYSLTLPAVEEVPEHRLATSAYKKLVVNRMVFSVLYKHLSKALNSGRKTIVIFKTVIAGEAFKKFCKGQLDFNVATGTFKAPLYAFAKGETNLLVACDKLVSEGLNLPDCDALFVLTQHTSPITTFQSVGRVLRKAPGKEKAVVVDIAVEGYPQFIRAKKSRLNTYREIWDDIKIVEVK